MARRKKRTARQKGHRRKFLVVIDETPECARALRFASRRAKHTGGGLTLLTVVSPADFQHWLGVENIMREEAHAAAAELLERMAGEAKKLAGIEAETVIREGDKADEIVNLIDEDADIAILVLAAASDAKGPGPLISSLASGAASRYPIPITIVPGELDDEHLDALS